jgi:hypothetical protein
MVLILRLAGPLFPAVLADFAEDKDAQEAQ